MKGLIYRELFVGRKSYILNIGLQIGFTAMCLLVRLSLRCGNLANSDAAYDINEMTFFMFSYYLPFFFFSAILSNEVHMSDVKSRYKLFSYTLPASPLKQTAAKFIVKLTLFVLELGFSLLNVFLITKIMPVSEEMLMIYDRKLDMYAPVFTIALLILLIDCLRSPAVLRGRTASEISFSSNAVSFASIILLMAVLRVAMVKYSEYVDINGPESAELFLEGIIRSALDAVNKLPMFFIPAAILLMAVNFAASVQAVKRREK